MTPSLKIIQWNIRGYQNNYNELQILLTQIRPHVITLQETHIQNSIPMPTPINYNIYTSTNPCNSFGGSAILIHKSIQHKIINHTTNTFDIVSIQIQSVLKFTISSIYLSPNKNFNTKNLQDIFDSLQAPLLITGDFNSWHPNWGSPKSNSRGNKLFKFVSQSRLILLNDGSPTHFTTHHTFTHVDLTIASPSIALQSNWQVESCLFGSDHFPIITTIFNNQSNTTINIRPRFNLNKANWEKFSTLANILCQAKPHSNNTNKEAATLHKIILQSANEAIPQTNYNTKKCTPWWNKELERLKKDRNRFWNKVKRHITTENIINYKRANALFKRELKLSKNKAMHKFTSHIHPHTPTGQLWHTIRRLCGLKPYLPIHSIALQDPIQTTTTNKLTIANSFGKYWSNEASDTNFTRSFLDHKYSSLTPINSLTPSKTALQIESDITPIELSIALSKLKGRTPGTDRISYPMIKNLPAAMKTRLLCLYNNILNNQIPQMYKSSLVLPIHKPNQDKSSIKSYRPISLNPVCAKLLDKVVANRLWWFVSCNKLLHSQQIGFRKGKSVSDYLVYLDHQITSSLSQKKHLSIISLDFTKAFDKIGIHTILDQLLEWKIGPKILNYIKNFMTNRKIKIRIDSHFSETYPLQNGIPQGSPISVILFLIAYHKLSNILSLHKEIDFLAYADDFTLIKKMNKHENTNIDLNDIHNDILNWCNYSGASLSTEKSKHIHICRKKHCHPNITCNNFTINNAENLKILGIEFNKRYRWEAHISKLVNSLNKRLNIIKCLSSPKLNANTSSIIAATKSLIVSKIYYGLYLFGYTPKSNINKLNSLLNSAIRTALGAYRTTPIRNMTFETGIPPLTQMREFATTKLCKNLIVNDQSTLSKLTHKIIISKRKHKIQSTLKRIIEKSLELDIPINYKPKTITRFPGWQLPFNAIDTSLHHWKKDNTPSTIFQKLFSELTNKLIKKKFKLIFTDGSKSANQTSFSVIYNDRILISKVLPYYSTNFAAETIAIFEAVQYASQTPGKFAICSDSLASLEMVKNINNNNYYTDYIRNCLLKFKNKIELIWIPGHAKIKGNELADLAAKEAQNRPLTMSLNLLHTDIKKHITKIFKNTQHSTFEQTTSWYKFVNPKKQAINEHTFTHNTNITRREITKIIRLRLGHTRLTHEYLIKKDLNICKYCNTSAPNIKHILDDCTHFTNHRKSLNNTKPTDLLLNNSTENIIKLINYLKYCNILNEI